MQRKNRGIKMELPKIKISDKEMKINLKRFVEEVGKEDGEELIVGNKEIEGLRKRIEKEVEKKIKRVLTKKEKIV